MHQDDANLLSVARECGRCLLKGVCALALVYLSLLLAREMAGRIIYAFLYESCDVTDKLQEEPGRNYQFDRPVWLATSDGERYLATMDNVANYPASYEDYLESPDSYPITIVDEIPAGTSFRVNRIWYEDEPWSGVSIHVFLEFQEGKFAGQVYSISAYQILNHLDGRNVFDRTPEGDKGSVLYKFKPFIQPAE